MADEDEEYLTPAQLGELLQVSEKTLRRWRSERIGPPFVQIDRIVRYRKRAALDWLREQEKPQEG
jgi:predicted nucleic acid-binding protein